MVPRRVALATLSHSKLLREVRESVSFLVIENPVVVFIYLDMYFV